MDNKANFVLDTLKYVKTNANYNKWSKEEAIAETLSLLVSDVGAAQAFLNAIGVKVDLYA